MGGRSSLQTHTLDMVLYIQRKDGCPCCPHLGGNLTEDQIRTKTTEKQPVALEIIISDAFGDRERSIEQRDLSPHV